MKMEALQKKFGDDRQKMQQAQMELFKRHGVNPLAGCLPMLLQMPIWMGLYRMLSHAGELHQAVFIPGWLDDLTLRDPYYILLVSLMGLMFLQSKLQPTSGDNAQQKMLTYGLPLMFGVMGLWFPAGLTVYITTNAVLGLLHTLYMKRSSPTPIKPAAPAPKDEAEDLLAVKALAKGEEAAKAVEDAAGVVGAALRTFLVQTGGAVSWANVYNAYKADPTSETKKTQVTNRLWPLVVYMMRMPEYHLS